MLDDDDDGRIRYKDAFPFLQRSGVTQELLLLVWEDAGIFQNADMVLEQWLLLCKSLTYSKKHTNFCSKANLVALIGEPDVGILEIFLDKLLDKYEFSTSSGIDLERCPTEVDVVSWENIVGSSMELGSSYSLYTIRYSTTLTHFTSADGETKRRYSDFVFLVEALGRKYRGCLIPPLPPKYDHLLDATYHASQNKADHVAQMRANDLSIFLKNLARHPILSVSLEFMVFLQASTAGFASYRLAVKKVEEFRKEKSSMLSPTMDNMVLMALSTSTAVSGVATSMFGAVNSFFGISEPEPIPEKLATELDMSDISVTSSFQEKFARMLHIAKCTKKASQRLDDLIRNDKNRVHEMDRICYFLDKSAKLPNDDSFNTAVSKFSINYDDVSTQFHKSLELQKIEVSNQLLNSGRFYHVLISSKEQLDADFGRLSDQKKDAVSYEKQLNRARKMNSINSAVLEKLERNIEVASERFGDIKVDLKSSMQATERDISWLKSLIRFELQGRMLGFAQMRAMACQNKAEVLSKLYDDISHS